MLALLVLGGALAGGAPRRLLAAGALLGVAVNVKIWFVVPLAVIVLWAWSARRSWREALLLLAGAAGASAVLDVPPFVLAPGRMWSMVVTAQLGRNANIASSEGLRLGQLTTLTQADPQHGHRVLLVLVLAAALVAVLLAWRVRAARLFVVLLLAQGGVLLAAPSWFAFYTDFAAVPAALATAGCAAAIARGRRRAPTVVAWVPAAAAAVLTAASLPGSAGLVQAVPDQARLVRAAARFPCIMADDPMTLIELDALGRSFAPGCHDWVDVTGRELGVVKPADRLRPGHPNEVWARDLHNYLLSGDAVVITRKGIGITGDTRREVEGGPLIASDGVYRLYATRHRYRVS